MKKLLILFVTLLSILIIFQACGNNSSSDPNDADDILPFIFTGTRTSQTVNGIGMEFAVLEGGSFTMGATGSDGVDQPGEYPSHSVFLSSFNIGLTEVTYAQWTNVANYAATAGYSFLGMATMGHVGGMGGTTSPDHPVVEITWDDAVKWCNALSELEGRAVCYYTDAAKSSPYRSGKYMLDESMVDWEANGYRLPTEAEWEYACRAGSQTAFHYGDKIGGNYGNFKNSGDPFDDGTTPVKYYTFGIHAWDIYDMHGNVFEWCWDYYDLYTSSSQVNPRGPTLGMGRVIRGGAYAYYPSISRTTARAYYEPDFFYRTIGFRVVENIPAGHSSSSTSSSSSTGGATTWTLGSTRVADISYPAPATGTWSVADVGDGIQGTFDNVQTSEMLYFNRAGLSVSHFAGTGIRVHCRGYGQARGTVYVQVKDNTTQQNYSFTGPATIIDTTDVLFALEFPYIYMTGPGWGEINSYANASEAITYLIDLTEISIIFEPTDPSPLSGSVSIYQVETYTGSSSTSSAGTSSSMSSSMSTSSSMTSTSSSSSSSSI